MFDDDLAELYGVKVKVLIQAVKRNRKRFPPDFVFQLNNQEVAGLRSQFVTLETGRGRHRKYLPYAFTEQGVAMLSSALHSDRAIQVNIEIMRAFVRLRRLLSSHKDLARKIEGLEKKYDAQFRVVFDAIRKLMEPPPPPPRKKIGFDLGFASIEFVAMAPIVAALILVIVQVSAVFTQSIADVAKADAAGDRAVREWDAAQAGRGLHRPCLEEMPVHSITEGGAPIGIGAGAWRRTVGVPQEVRLVSEPVCDR